MTFEYQKYTLPMRRRFQLLRERTVANKKRVIRGPQLHGLVGASWNTDRLTSFPSLPSPPSKHQNTDHLAPHSSHMNLATARSYADKIVEWLAPHCERIEIAGSIRRERPECRDVDIVCIPKITEERDMLGEVVHRRNHVHHHLNLHALAGKCRIESGGDTEGKLMIVQLTKCQLDVYFATPDTFATILLCRTGSKEHNILICQRALDRGGHWQPNESLTIKGSAIAAIYEQHIYDALKLPWIDPRDREGEHVATLIRSHPCSSVSIRG